MMQLTNRGSDWYAMNIRRIIRSGVGRPRGWLWEGIRQSAAILDEQRDDRSEETAGVWS